MEKELNQLKNKYSIDWREFEIQSLFEKVPTKKLPYKAQDLKNRHDKIYCLPALTAGTLNQGLAYYVPREGATILKNVISVSANGANTGVMYYQPREFTVLQDSYAIKYIHDELKPKHYTYLVSALQKSIGGRFDWSNKAGWERIKTELIKLPVKFDGKIAFDYIEEFVNTLEAYLQAKGLKTWSRAKRKRKVCKDLKQLARDRLNGINFIFMNYLKLIRLNLIKD
ncbi:restriction endonuclease subunit S [Lactococcus cremoris]|uniref:Type II restriction endonuclease subunit R n=1 Tax=Lactococcus cremoris subsp. tructae TaxID=542833 RepID=A0A2A5SQ01_LACLC|nr:restriction endonuclease subunit S [Lactococcus cremoris]PCS16238.1 type II restriction endonuclease subunit R [Lactococcus cremoris subsp. tructae]